LIRAIVSIQLRIEPSHTSGVEPMKAMSPAKSTPSSGTYATMSPRV
jgi:hypothetical protein